MADETIWRVKFRGTEYELRQSDLSISNMRHAEQWYGEDYASYNGFLARLFMKNVNALACAMWMVQKAAGENPPEPQHMDFSLADFEDLPIEKPKGKKAKGNPTRTPGSTGASANSEPSTSST